MVQFIVWEFLLQQITGKNVLNIYSSKNKWGFQAFWMHFDESDEYMDLQIITVFLLGSLTRQAFDFGQDQSLTRFMLA